jgi:hypothetical protein
MDPTPIVLHRYLDWKDGNIHNVEVKGYIVNFLDSLKALLSNSSFFSEVSTVRASGYMMSDVQV